MTRDVLLAIAVIAWFALLLGLWWRARADYGITFGRRALRRGEPPWALNQPGDGAGWIRLQPAALVEGRRLVWGMVGAGLGVILWIAILALVTQKPVSVRPMIPIAIVLFIFLFLWVRMLPLKEVQLECDHWLLAPGDTARLRVIVRKPLPNGERLTLYLVNRVRRPRDEIDLLQRIEIAREIMIPATVTGEVWQGEVTIPETADASFEVRGSEHQWGIQMFRHSGFLTWGDLWLLYVHPRQ